MPGSELIRFDIDGRLASWSSGARAHYEDARQSVIDSAARLGPIRYLKQLMSQGHDVAILTDRGAQHGPGIHSFTNRSIPVITRPSLEVQPVPSRGVGEIPSMSHYATPMESRFPAQSATNLVGINGQYNEWCAMSHVGTSTGGADSRSS